MSDSYSRIGYSAVTAATGSVTFKLGHGEWEISNISVIMGSKVPTLDGMEIGEGHVVFERLEGDAVTVIESHHLVVGRFTRVVPLVMQGPKRLRGPGQVKSYINHGDDSAYDHTMAMLYRRVMD